MNRHFTEIADTGTAPVIDLAREPAFALGHASVVPAALRLEVGDWSQRLEPRAMQVLVVLAQSSPAVVGRGELNARAWGGRVVGDDAINRAVQKLRRAATEAPPPAPFTIETVPRVGYRLTAAARADLAPAPVAVVDPVVDETPRAASWRTRRGVLVAVAALVLAEIVVWRIASGRDPALAWRIAASATIDDLPPGARDVALSPDGQRLAFRQDVQGRDRIFVRATRDGGAGRAVSPEGLDARHPAWSPDGRALAFTAYDADRPCRLYVVVPGRLASPAGSCETERDPRLAWSADGRALLFGDASGVNAVVRIGAVGLADGQRTVLTNPPGDTLGDDLPTAQGNDIVFLRRFAAADEGWIARDLATGRERLLWRRRDVAGSVAAPLPDGGLAIAWTRAGASGLDFVDAAGRARSQPVAVGAVTAIAVAGSRLLIETDRSESALVRAASGAAPAAVLATMRGAIAAPVLLPDGRVRFPVASAGVARIWERDPAGSVRPWGAFVAARIVGLALSPDGRLTSAIVIGNGDRAIVVFDAAGKPVYRWQPHARALNNAAWTGDGRHLIVPVLDGAGWRLVVLDPFGGAAPHDPGLAGFALVFDHKAALFAVRAGEATGIRELWRIDGQPRRLAVDLTLFDIVNWRAVDDGVWLPDRSDRDHPRLVLRDGGTGRVLRSVAAPGLAASKTGLAADARGPVYVESPPDAPGYGLLTLARTGDPAP